MSGAPARGTAPRRQRRHHHHHHHHHHHQKHRRAAEERPEEPDEKRPKVNPIFLWASQREQRIVEVKCEDYDKRNRIKLTKTAQGWRSIPRTASNMYSAGFAAPKPCGANTSDASDVDRDKGKRAASQQQRVLGEEPANGGLMAADGRKGGREFIGKSRHGYGFPLEEMRNYARINWDEEEAASCSGEGEEDEEGDENKAEEETTRCNARSNLERLQESKLFQPRVVLEQLHLSRLPGGVYRNVLRRRGTGDKERDEGDGVEVKPVDGGKRRRGAGIRDILNMIDVTASPVLAADTPSADLPVDSTKTYENFRDEEKKEPSSAVSEEQTRPNVISIYRHEDVDESLGDDKIEIHEEKVLAGYEIVEPRPNNDVVYVSVISKTPESCEVVEADGGKRPRSSSEAEWQSDDGARVEAKEERPDEPGKMDYNESSKILDALRKTPGLSISVTRVNAPEDAKVAAAPPRPASKASSSSRSPDSQAECAERSSKGVDSETRNASPKNLPGLSIIIPNYRYRGSVVVTSNGISPGSKSRVESPESTVNFAKNEAHASKLDGFPHEVGEDDGEMDEEEDDYDSQVLEDLRQQKSDPLTCESDYYHRRVRNSEAQAKSRYQDVEHFDEQVLEELRTRGTVVSPQPSGIPCSPASRRPSSAYLERLLPSPPCSVSCSEDAKNDLTLKGLLSSPNQLELRDYEKQKDLSSRCDQVPSDHLPARIDLSKDEDRFGRKESRTSRASVQEARNSGKSDVHNAYSVAKRPTSAEWTFVRQRNQSSSYRQKPTEKSRAMEEAFATSSSTDRLMDPAGQLRELIETSGHLIPDPLLVPRDYLPGLAAAPAIEIPKLLASRPELRLPEALTRPDLLRDPDLLVISLAHLQYVLDHGEGPVSRSRQSHARGSDNAADKGSGHASNETRTASQARPKLSCKPIGTLMPAPIDLSSSRRTNGSNAAVSYLPLLRVRNGLLKQEPVVSSTASSPDESQLWHPLFSSQKRQQQHHQYRNGHQHQQQIQHQQPQQQHASWHRTTLAS